MSDDMRPTTLPPRTRHPQGRRPSPNARAVTSRRPPQRAEARDRSRARLYSVAALILSILLLGACVLGVFTVRNVEVVGTGLPVETLTQAAAVTGQNIFTVRTDQIIRRLASLPAVEVTRVETDFPDRVVIYAHMRQAVILWQSPRGTFLVDRYGHIIGPGARASLPLVTGPQPPNADVIVAVGYVLRLLPVAPDGAVSGLSLDPGTGLNVHGRSGWQAVLGSGRAQVLVNRVANLQALLRGIARRGQRLAYADMRYKGAYYRVRGS